MIDSYVGGAVVAGWFLIICIVVLCIEKRYSQQEGLPRSSPGAITPLAIPRPKLVNPTHHRSYQNNARVGTGVLPKMHQWMCRSTIPIGARLCNDKSGVTPADHQSQFMNSILVHPALATPPSQPMTPVPRESAKGQGSNAFVLS